METTNMLEQLPEKSQMKAYDYIRELVLAWDPNFTKTTPKEKRSIDEAIKEYKDGEYIEVLKGFFNEV